MEVSQENEELILVHVHKVMQSRFYTLFILEGLEKKFTIYTEPSVGLNITNLLSTKQTQRPQTHHLIQMILAGVDATPIKSIIYDVKDNIYKSYLILKKESEKEPTYLQIDTRPSDCLTLSLIHKTPLYCLKEAFQKASFIED